MNDPLVEVISNARHRWQRAIDDQPDGIVDELDDQGRTFDRAIADAVDQYLLRQILAA